MKLYVWTGVFSDYSDGMAVALASSKQEAMDAIGEVAAGKGVHAKGNRACDCYSCEQLRNEEPQVIDPNRKTPIAWQMSGGG